MQDVIKLNHTTDSKAAMTTVILRKIRTDKAGAERGCDNNAIKEACISRPRKTVS